MHCIICRHLLLALFALDPVELQELTPVEAANPEQDQCKPQYI
jgi:hypothetical protein